MISKTTSPMTSSLELDCGFKIVLGSQSFQSLGLCCDTRILTFILSLPTYPSADGRFRAKCLQPSSTRSTPTSSYPAHLTTSVTSSSISVGGFLALLSLFKYNECHDGPKSQRLLFLIQRAHCDKYLYIQERRRGRR